MKGKKIIVTGASSGIGAELCKLLCKENTVFAVARTVEKIEHHDNIIPYRCDLSVAENIEDLLQKAMDTMGGIDIFIANAGFAYYELFNTPDIDHIERIFNINVFSVIHAIAAFRAMKKNEPFVFAVTASAMCFLSMPGYSLYSATKYALKGFTDAYRFELPKHQKLCMIYPIATLTSFFDVAGSKNLPWPRQKAVSVARTIIKGIDTGKKHVFPSKTFRIMLFLNRFLPVFTIYAAIENKKMRKALVVGGSYNE